MKVLVWTRPIDFEGGDIRFGKMLVARLRKLGVEADFSDKYGMTEVDLEPYDLVHLIVMDTINNSDKLKVLKRKKIVCSIIYRDTNYGE